MIDLDELLELPSTTELYCRFGVALIIRKINYAEWRKLVTGFHLFVYINPSARTINPDLIDWVYIKYKCADLSFLVAAGMLLRNLETHYTEVEQLRMIEILQNS